MQNCNLKIFMLKSNRRGDRKNDVNAMRCFAGNSSFCQVHAFKSGHLLHPLRQFFICMFYLLKFHTKVDFLFKYYILKFYLQC